MIKLPDRLLSRSIRPTERPRNDGTAQDADIKFVKIPVRCPHCETEQLCEQPEPVLMVALTRWNNMNLYAPCHDVYWSASRSELKAIRDYLGESWFESRSTAQPA